MFYKPLPALTLIYASLQVPGMLVVPFYEGCNLGTCSQSCSVMQALPSLCVLAPSEK
jgi:hypothetical protein